MSWPLFLAAFVGTLFGALVGAVVTLAIVIGISRRDLERDWRQNGGQL